MQRQTDLTHELENAATLRLQIEDLCSALDDEYVELNRGGVTFDQIKARYDTSYGPRAMAIARTVYRYVDHDDVLDALKTFGVPLLAPTQLRTISSMLRKLLAHLSTS